MNPKEILPPEDYRNYRNVRAVAVLFMAMSALYVLVGILAVAFTGEILSPKEKKAAFVIAYSISAIAIVIGIIGIIGGIAARRGNRKWSPLIYASGAICMCNFPLGTILGVIMLKGLPRYFDSIELIKATNKSMG